MLEHSENGNGQGDKEQLEEFSAVFDMRKKAMLLALKKSLGIVSQAAKIAGCHRDSHYNWMKDDPAYKSAVASIQESALDFAESKLFELINGISMRTPTGLVYTQPPNVAATIFYLKTKAKKRGYIERLQLQDMSDEEVESTLDI